MDNLNDVARQRAKLEQQLSELERVEERLKLEAQSLVSVDEQVYVIKDFQRYKLELRQRSMGKTALFTDICIPFISSDSKEELENEMLCLIQRLIDATIQLRQIKD